MHNTLLEHTMDQSERMAELMDRNFPQTLSHQLLIRGEVHTTHCGNDDRKPQRRIPPSAASPKTYVRIGMKRSCCVTPTTRTSLLTPCGFTWRGKQFGSFR